MLGQLLAVGSLSVGSPVITAPQGGYAVVPAVSLFTSSPQFSAPVPGRVFVAANLVVASPAFPPPVLGQLLAAAGSLSVGSPTFSAPQGGYVVAPAVEPHRPSVANHAEWCHALADDTEPARHNLVYAGMLQGGVGANLTGDGAGNLNMKRNGTDPLLGALGDAPCATPTTAATTCDVIQLWIDIDRLGSCGPSVAVPASS